MKKFLFLLVSVFLSCYFTSKAQDPGEGMKHTGASHVMLNGMDLKWADGPPALPKGAQAVILEGDPSKEGLFTVRLSFPANYKVPPHWHPTTEHVTVLEGTLYMGTTDKIDEQTASPMNTGGFVIMPAKMTHYAFTKDKCVIQIHAMGPFEITYINPADDPRKK